MIKYFPLFFLAFFLPFCGDPADSSDDASVEDTNNTVNTEKLIGTPFEGLTTGDDFDWDFFTANEYQTLTVDEIPIKIFAAFFTEDEEVIIQEGIDIANTAMEDIFYVLTDEWSDDVRVIYQVEDIVREDGYDPDARGHTEGSDYYFNDHKYSERVMMDWRAELTQSGTNKYTAAHELGHASGIGGHWLIDYENDTFLPDELEDNSLMSGDYSIPPEMTDYTYMMQMQGQIMKNYLGELGTPN